jgi:hypothetical protein
MLYISGFGSADLYTMLYHCRTVYYAWDSIFTQSGAQQRTYAVTGARKGVDALASFPGSSARRAQSAEQRAPLLDFVVKQPWLGRKLKVVVKYQMVSSIGRLGHKVSRVLSDGT